MAKPKSIHYIDNEKFLKEMVIYKRELDEAKSKDEFPPIISEYLGDCFMKIAQRLSFRPNFINYAFKDEMISDGIENCVQYIKNFNPEKSSNPFAYFTQIIYYAFIRRIQKEKKQLYIKYKTMDEFSSLEENSDMEAMGAKESASVTSGASPMTADKRASIYDFIHAFEEKKKSKKKPKPEVDNTLAKLSPLVEFMEEAYA